MSYNSHKFSSKQGQLVVLSPGVAAGFFLFHAFAEEVMGGVVGFEAFENGFHKFLSEKYPDLVNDVEKLKELTDSIAQRLDKSGSEFKTEFLRK